MSTLYKLKKPPEVYATQLTCKKDLKQLPSNIRGLITSISVIDKIDTGTTQSNLYMIVFEEQAPSVIIEGQWIVYEDSKFKIIPDNHFRNLYEVSKSTLTIGRNAKRRLLTEVAEFKDRRLICDPSTVVLLEDNKIIGWLPTLEGVYPQKEDHLAITGLDEFFISKRKDGNLVWVRLEEEP